MRGGYQIHLVLTHGHTRILGHCSHEVNQCTTGGSANDPIGFWDDDISRTKCWKLLKISECHYQHLIILALARRWLFWPWSWVLTPYVVRKPYSTGNFPSSNAILRCLHDFSRQEVPKLPPEAHSSSIETSEGTLKAGINFTGTCWGLVFHF